jgi:predicted acylesterase/phospholipase RssA
MFKLRPQIGREQIGQFKKFRQTIYGLMDGNWDNLIHLKWLKMSGIFSTAGIEQYLREEVLPSNQFQDYIADLFIVATQLNHSRKVVFGKYDYQPPVHDLNCQYSSEVGIADACAASTALPIIFAPHAIKGPNQQVTHYIDGEIRETLSTHVAVDSGADLVIASYTHQPYHVPVGGISLTEFGLPAIAIQSIYLLIEQKINAHRYRRQTHRNAIDAVSQYCKSQAISENQRLQICQILEVQLNHRMDVDTIYIHPNPSDAQLFFGEHFSLSPKKMTEIVKSGFRAAIETLRKYDFSDREKGPAMGVTQLTD